MAIVVHGGGGVGDEVPAVDVVDVAVVIVVEVVVGDFVGVDPEVGGQVGVGEVHAGVDDGDDDGGAAGGDAPGFGSVDVSVRGATGLTCVVEVPLLIE